MNFRFHKIKLAHFYIIDILVYSAHHFSLHSLLCLYFIFLLGPPQND